MNLAELLFFLRQDLGGKTAKSFHSDLTKRGLNCNYSTYIKIETGTFLPSPALVIQLAHAVPAKWQEEVILAYNRSQFPKFGYLFVGDAPSGQVPPNSRPLPTVNMAQELSRRQVAVLARTQVNYNLFLVLTLARKALSRKELERKFKKENFQQAFSELLEAGFLDFNEEQVRMRTTEWKFPLADEDPSLKKIYRQFDEWDLSFGEQFGFETLLSKMLIRRISPRYLSLIQKQLEVCVDLVKSSDELESKFNQSLVQVRIQLKSGQLPG